MDMCSRGIRLGGKKTKVERWRVGGGVASHKWWERPARQTEGMIAISIR